MKDYKHVFIELPNVKTIWVTDNGDYHLHPANGGTEIKREDALKELEVKEVKAEQKQHFQNNPKKK